MKRKRWVYLRPFSLHKAGLSLALLLLFACLLWQDTTVIPSFPANWTDKEGIQLRQQIERLAQEKRKEPVDARVDQVWKAIPELNGLEVDREATYQKALQTPGGRIPLVYRQIPPRVTLQDLGPQPIYRGNPQKRQIALMVNVAWGNEYILPMLELFQQYHVTSTFFLDGSWLKKNAELAKRIVAAGHEIGNHAYSHSDMARLSPAQARSEISRTNDLIREVLGKRATLFAPPSGSYTDETVRLAAQEGMRTILWTLDTVDWKRPPATVISRKIINQADNGFMVLMHPTEPTVGALRTMIPELQKKGFQLVTVSQLLSPERTPDP